MDSPTGSARRPRKERKANAEQRRRQLMNASVRSIETHGLARTTLATVAAEAGLSQGVAVFYYKSKTGLLTEVLRHFYGIYESHWQAELAAAGDRPIDRLIAVVRADFQPEICNRQMLSVWFAFWGEQSFTPNYAEVTHDFDMRRAEAIVGVCKAVKPDDEALATLIADWTDTLTDGYWQNLHLERQRFSPEKGFLAVMQFLEAVLPEYRTDLRLAPGPRRPSDQQAGAASPN